jgi:diguanylate cyclase (GGDEF)-like protein
MACDSLALKRRLEQSQRHASLLSRTAHVLNTSVNLDRAIQGVLAEMGQSMRCDRLVLFDLRQQAVAMLSSWERPRQRLASLNPGTLTYALWQDTIDLFLQGGASYVEFRLTEPDADPLQAWLSQSGVESALLLPVFIREDFFGAIALLSGRHDRHYSLDELQMARQNTDQLSIALAMIQYSRASALANPATVQPLTATMTPTDPFTDPITNLPNSDAFERELDTLSQPSVWAFRPPFSLIVCDVDYFKLVNDNHGVDVGDRVLQRIAQKLQHQLRRDTPIYRYGGEEFAIILQETDLQTAKEVAERLRQAVRSMPMRTSSEVLTVTLSFGVAQLKTEGDRHALDVLRRAEQALFEAKRQGRDRVAIR